MSGESEMAGTGGVCDIMPCTFLTDKYVFPLSASIVDRNLVPSWMDTCVNAPFVLSDHHQTIRDAEQMLAPPAVCSTTGEPCS